MLSFYALLVMAAVANVQGYSSGAPESSCVDMIPKHPVDPQKSAAPYIITTSSKVVKAGEPLQVVITGKGSQTIKGLLLQARDGAKPIGKFVLPPNHPIAQLLNCGSPGNAITHKKHDDSQDQQTVTFTWIPPAGFNGEIKFRATVAFNGAVFWTGIESAPIKVTN